jgi:hypothetical protein
MPAAAAGPATTQASATQPAAATNAVAAPPPPVTQPSNPPHDAEAPQVIRPIPTSDGAKVLEGPDEGKP